MLELVKQKGVYLYEDIGSSEKLSEDKLPDKCKLFSSLKGEDICWKDGLHAIIIWNTFKKNRMGEYHDHYLKKKKMCFYWLMYLKCSLVHA